MTTAVVTAYILLSGFLVFQRVMRRGEQARSLKPLPADRGSTKILDVALPRVGPQRRGCRLQRATTPAPGPAKPWSRNRSATRYTWDFAHRLPSAIMVGVLP